MIFVRVVVYLAFAAFLGLAILDVRNPDSIVFGTMVAGVLLLSRRSFRARAEETLRVSRMLRVFDLVLWNFLLTFLVLEVFLAVAYWVTKEPILISPNARSQERIARYKGSLADRSEADPRNSQGFNDSEWVVPKPPGSLRVVALGDSFAFGVVGYKRNFLTLLEHDLTERWGSQVEVCNLGIPATDPVDYLEILNGEGMLLEPDLILVCLFSGNDFVRTSRGSLLRLRNTRIFSVFWRFWRLQIERRRRQSQRVSDDFRTEGVFQTAPLSAETHLEVTERYLEFLAADYRKETRRKIDDTLDVLDQIGFRLGPRRLLIAVLPNEVQVNPQLRRKVCRRRHVSVTELDLHRPGREVSAHFASSEVEVVDLLPAFLEVERTAPTYRIRDTHWNVHGNRVAARALLPHLEAKLRSLLAAELVSRISTE